MTIGETLLKAFAKPRPVSKVRIRHPEKLDIITGLEPMELDMDWVWVAEQQGKQIAVMVAANFHGMAFMLRLIALPEAPPSTVLHLLREASKEAQKRGTKGFASMFDLTVPVERRMWTLAKKMGAVQIGKVHILAMGWRLI
jgi:hypothetical protein